MLIDELIEQKSAAYPKADGRHIDKDRNQHHRDIHTALTLHRLGNGCTDAEGQQGHSVVQGDHL